MSTMQTPLCAVVVTHKYPLDDLYELLDLLHPAVQRIVLIDNTPLAEATADSLTAALRQRYPTCRPLLNGINLGLAKGLNQGIQVAIDESYPWVILFDQDSRPEPDMIPRLLAARQQHNGSAPLAALGPTIHDIRQGGTWPFLRFNYAGPQKNWPDTTRATHIEADMLITSGCLISIDAIQRIGMMDERFFIDNIDLEWCFRARSKGYILLGVSNAVLKHHLGDTVRKIPGIQRSLIVHSPTRQYHITRNRIMLYWRGYVPLAWKLHDFPRLLYKLMIYPLVVAPRAKNLRMILKGIWHGLIGR